MSQEGGIEFTLWQKCRIKVVYIWNPIQGIDKNKA